MKLKEAKEIIGYILEWQFVCMGIKERSEITKKVDLSKYSLSDLIQANKIIEHENKRKEKIAEYHRGKGHKVKGYFVSMVLADRSIAAVYTALSFSPNGEMIALINDCGIGCIRASYE
jgi:hypothetical protein